MATARYHKVKIGEHELNAETLMLGYGYDPSLSEGSVKPPVFLTSTFVFGTVTLPDRARNKSAGMLGSRRSDDVAPRLHRCGPEGSVRFCGGEMALDVESVVSGCMG